MLSNKPIEKMIIFGGAGLVGYQIARLSGQHFPLKHLVVCSLFEKEAQLAAEELKKEFPHIKQIDYEYGNIFVRDSFSKMTRNSISSNQQSLSQIYDDVFGEINDDVNNIANQNLMGKIILKYKPDAVVDCINTATGISYQDVKSSSFVVKRFKDQTNQLLNSVNIDDLEKKSKQGDPSAIEQLLKTVKDLQSLSFRKVDGFPEIDNMNMIDLLLISQSVPQLVRHVLLLHKALCEVGAHIYVKVGTTGTGGMGINIPYTHGEDKPSFSLMAKSSVGFAHTGLLFLLARSEGPIIKEIKPGAMIGYKDVLKKKTTKFGQPVFITHSKTEKLGDCLEVRQNPDNYTKKNQMELVGIDTGENGFFTRGEFEAITYMDQMEFVTPEEIAKNVIFEICGNSTGKDVIAAIDGSIMAPSYRAGYVRQNAIEQMSLLEKQENIPSVAIGELGPPQLSKLLYETYLLKQFYPKLTDLADSALSPEQISNRIETYIKENEIKDMITSLGLAILLSDGTTLLRGPKINIPESKVDPKVNVTSYDDINKWATKGWVDLRPENMKLWKKRACNMLESQDLPFQKGSSAYGGKFYPRKTLEIGEVVGWIFNVEFGGERIK